MNSPFRGKVESALGRLLAGIALIGGLPALLFFGLLLRSTSKSPVLLMDEVVGPWGSKANVHRFRTTGSGGPAFHAIGRFVRSLGYDDLPALWDVVRGEIGLMQFYHLCKRQ